MAQLAASIGALMRREWTGPNGELAHHDEIYPVLLVYDRRMASPGTGRFLDGECRQLLGPIPNGIRVHPVILMTVADLEFIVSTLEPQSLLRLLGEYSDADSERLSSFHNFVLRVRPRDPDSSSPMLEELTEELMAAMRSTIVWNSEAPASPERSTDQ